MNQPPDNPYASPEDEPAPRRGPSTDPSIEHEPHLRPGGFLPDRSEERVPAVEPPHTPDDAVDHTVWDEPALGGMTAAPRAALTYANWLQQRRAETPAAATWRTTFLVALAAGPWAILGTFMSGIAGSVPVLIVVVGPLTEEIMKIAATMWVVEKKPYLFQSTRQILLCAFAGGLVFAVIENFMYLLVYIPDPSPEIVLWRWTVCVALHTGCSTIAGWGLARVWSRTMRDRVRAPDRLGRHVVDLRSGGAWRVQSVRLVVGSEPLLPLIGANPCTNSTSRKRVAALRVQPLTKTVHLSSWLDKTRY